jgi:hypothetical protein
MKDVHWIDTGQWPPALAVIADKRAYKRFIRKHCGDHAADCPPFPGTNAGLCQKLEDGSDCIFVIAVGEQKDQIELAGTLAHEATHAMRWLFEHIGEKDPGTETQAYLVEHIVRNGMRALA